ncbi:MAG TPA: hypothetical protein DCE23_09190 [Firmicutes bacterium]|nr:hypothetical protein [Bacillota bacterium]
MRKDIIIILVLVFVVIGLSGGIFFAVKTDFFSGRDSNTIDKRDNNTEEENKKEDVVDSPKEENKKEENVEKPEEVKPEEVKAEDKNSEANDKPSNDKNPSSDKNNNKPSSTGGNDTKNENTPVTPPKEDKPVTPPKEDEPVVQPLPDKPVIVDPTIPKENDTMTSLVCSIDLPNEDDIPTKQIVTMSFYDSTKLPWSIIMTSYMDLSSFNFTDSEIKEFKKEIEGSIESIPGFKFETWQTGDIIELSYSSTAPELRKYYPDEYKIGGEMSYDVTKRDFIEQGYTCK